MTSALQLPESAPESCAHCGAELGTPIVDDSGLRFCCRGCSTVYGAIHAAGLEAFYTDREISAVRARPARPSGRRFAEFDDPALATRFDAHADGTCSIELSLEGVHCAACVWLVESLPRVVGGVHESRLDFGRSTASVRWDPARAPLSRIAAALDSLGYTPHVPGQASEGVHGDRTLLMRLGVAGAIAGNVMLMALALYSGASSGVDGNYAEFFRWGSLVLSLPSVFYCAAIFYRGAFASIRARVASMDLPIAIGITAGFVSGAVNTWRGHGEIYFDTITVLIFLLLVGRWLGQRQQRRAATAADFALAVAPSVARVVESGAFSEARAEAVPSGALVEVRSGERVPIDGRVEQGESSIDARWLTGESEPIDVRPGDRVYAGTENVGGTFRVRAERAGRETRVGQLVQAMERARLERAPITRVADRLAAYFVPVVLACAGLTLAIWWRTDPTLAVEHAVALLVVTCPCALGMATPLSVSVALARAARRGILVKGGEVLEALAKPAHFVFDKSGTLTAGRPELLEWHGSPELALSVSAAEAGCDHPLAHALQRAFPVPAGLEAQAIERFAGGGVRARVSGKELVVGTASLLEQCGVVVDAEQRARVEALAERGATPVLVAEDGRVAGLAAFGDPLRPEVAACLAELARLGNTASVLSGDHPRVVERVCGELPVAEFLGAVSPERKLEEVKALRARGKSVVMVGDGVNDAAAMSAATVGFAVHGGAEASLLAASVFATEPGVSPVIEAVRGAQKTLGAIRRGLGFSLAYNALGVALAMSGVLSPLWAAVMMPLSSLTVLSVALRSGAFSVRPRRRSLEVSS